MSAGYNSVSSFISNMAQQAVSSDLYTPLDFSSALSFSNIPGRNFSLDLIILGFQTALGLVSMM